MKKFLIVLAVMVGLTVRVSADEGMWLLPMLEKLNIKDMKAKGFKLSAKDIYNINGTALKDAVVIFGNGCTGEIVSPEGLLFTNHHCGFASIQALSSVEHDYLKNGFWAMNRSEEIPAPGLTVRFIRHMEDVTEDILSGVTDTMTEEERAKKIDENSLALQVKWMEKYPEMDVDVKDFFGGNQFLAFVVETFSDVRLVGAPPQSIGKFGGETDNWMWPRHTGDFSVFRVYADKNGKPAAYSKENVPYKSPAHLKVSLKGYDEGDFAMIIGFPGSTERYMTSYEIDQTLNVDNPNRIFIRGVRQDILREDMAASDEVRIKYASKFASSSNYWKNSIGMSRGLKKLHVKEKKEALEERFKQWAAASPERAEYAKALPLIEESVRERIPYYNVVQYLSESMIRATELLSASALGGRIPDSTKLTLQQYNAISKSAKDFYEDYNEATDRKVAKAMLKIVADSLPADQLPSVFETEIKGKFNGDIDAYVDDLYDRSVFANKERFMDYLEAGDYSSLKSDPAVMLRKSVVEVYNRNLTKYLEINKKFEKGHRLLVAGLMEMEPEEKHYPDANFTMRLTYGNILPYNPADAIKYNYYTTLSGVIAKEDPSNPVEFTVPEKLKELYEAKDFGQYAYQGDIPVAFLSNNDITGGNSGSPVLNARGELIGLAFDGNWEAMSGDIAFEPDLQRTISVDIRYVLFLIDKFAGAGYLLNEMTLVK